MGQIEQNASWALASTEWCRKPHMPVIPHFASPSEAFAFSTDMLHVQLVDALQLQQILFFLLICYCANGSSPRMWAIYSCLKPVLCACPYWTTLVFLQLSLLLPASVLNSCLPVGSPPLLPWCFCPPSPIPQGFMKMPWTPLWEWGTRVMAHHGWLSPSPGSHPHGIFRRLQCEMASEALLSQDIWYSLPLHKAYCPVIGGNKVSLTWFVLDKSLLAVTYLCAII